MSYVLHKFKYSMTAMRSIVRWLFQATIIERVLVTFLVVSDFLESGKLCMQDIIVAISLAIG